MDEKRETTISPYCEIGVTCGFKEDIEIPIQSIKERGKKWILKK